MKQILFCFAIFLSINLSAQNTGYLVEGPSQRSGFADIKRLLRKDDLTSIEKSFLEFDSALLKRYIHPNLVDKQLFEILGLIRASLSKRNITLVSSTYYETYQYSPHFLIFSGKILNLEFLESKRSADSYPDFKIEYGYIIIDSAIKINKIDVKFFDSNIDFSFPKELREIEIASLKLEEEDMRYDSAVFLEQKIRKLCVKIPDLGYNFLAEDKLKKCFSTAYGNLSWHQLLKQRYKEALKASIKGLAVDSSQTWINTNLALAYLFNGQFNKAKAIYSSLRDTPIDKKRKFKEAFLQDIDSMEKNGIRNSKFGIIRNLLK